MVKKEIVRVPSAVKTFVAFKYNIPVLRNENTTIKASLQQCAVEITCHIAIETPEFFLADSGRGGWVVLQRIVEGFFVVAAGKNIAVPGTQNQY